MILIPNGERQKYANVDPLFGSEMNIVLEEFYYDADDSVSCESGGSD